MCGIIAIIGSHTKVDCSKALSKMEHRGEDGSRLFNSSEFSIGFNRLAINDNTENGMQPFKFNNLIGAFNGEIFNYKELAEKYKISLKSESDIEIILPLFKIVGCDIINVLDGFYSGIIYDKETKQVFTLRDYIGKKPLFYGKSSNLNFICSELKSIEEIESFDFVPKGFTEIKDGKLVLIKEHTFPLLEKSTLKDVISKSIIKRVPINQKYGVFLSGGLDSSIIASVLAQYSSNVIFYTLGNQESEDVSFVKALGNYLGIENQIKFIPLPKKEEMSSLISKLVYHTESYNPSIISNGLATYLLSREAKKDGLKVVISGEGADELFCGYKISKDIIETREKSNTLIENLHFTELRRLDLSSMANTIEIRCPFLDKEVYSISKNLSIEELKNKQILRSLFDKDLPKEIIARTKTSFDVGSGIRKLVVEQLLKADKTEKEALRVIWDKFFNSNLANHKYYHSYPIFDKAINKRGIKHK